MSFRLKAFITVGLFQAVLLIALVLSNLSYLRNSYDQEIQKRAVVTGNLFVASIKDAVIATDLATIQSALQELLKNSDVVYARVYDQEGRLLAAGGDRQVLNRPFVADPNVDSVNDGVYDLQLPIEEAGSRFGRIQIGIGIKAMRQIVVEVRNHNLAIAVLAIIVFVLLSVFLGRYLTRQLAALERASMRLAQGDYDQRVAVTGHDELTHTAKVFNDMAERLKVTHDQLELAAGVFAHASEAIVISDAERRVVAVNPAFTAMTGYTETDVLGQPMFLCDLEHHDQEFIDAMQAALERDGLWQGEVWNRRKNGDVFPQWLSVVSLRESHGGGRQYISLFMDITERKRSEERVWHQANYDHLTELPNRVLFADRLSQALRLARRGSTHVALLYVDLDRFKEVNDTLGHAYGDRLLQQVAKRMLRNVRETDTVARLAGDEFAIVLADYGGQRAVEMVAEKLIGALAMDFELDDRRARVTASIGIAVYPEDGGDADVLLRNADRAMYRAKQGGRNTFCFFTQAMNKDLRERQRQLEALRRAIDDDTLELVYQPIFNLHDGQVVGAEALLRWHDEKAGDVAPREVLTLAEEGGILHRLEQRVLERACTEAARWQESHPGMFVSVNASGNIRLDDNWTQRVSTVLERCGLPPDALCLEVREGTLLEGGEAMSQMLTELHRKGVRLAVDNFGTGYSSLSYLKRFPVGCIKIDPLFIGALPGDLDALTLVETILVAARRLRIHVVAEGVESDAQLTSLRDMGCETAQGYVFAPPMEADALQQMLAKADQ